MSLHALKEALPSYAKDLKLNLSSLPKTPGLSARQLWGAALAVAVASRNGRVIRAISAEAEAALEEAEIEAAKAAASIMSMNNIYYRFVHLAGPDRYGTLPARLRMQVIGRPGVDRLDFELWCTAVSAVNGCGMCIESHERELTEKGLDRTSIQNAARIAAIVHGVAVTLEGEAHSAAAGRAGEVGAELDREGAETEPALAGA